eukprot:c7791_g2_i1 orf=234-1208(+)
MKPKIPVLVSECLQQREELTSSPGPLWRMLKVDKVLPLLEETSLPPSSIEVYACMLYKCRKERNRAQALHLNALLQESGLETPLGNCLVSLLVDVGSMNAAQQVFDRLSIQKEGSWHSLMVGYVKCGKPQHALTLYRKLQMDVSTYLNGPISVAVLKACAELKDQVLGSEVHAEVARTGLLERDLFVGSALIDMYAKFCMLTKAQQVFDQLSIRNVVSWNTLMAAYAHHGYGHETLKCFDQMRRDGASPDPVTFVCSLKACSSIQATDKGQEIHDEIERRGLLEKDYIIGGALVDMYVKGGSLVKAQQLFNKLPVRDVVAWTAL